MSPNLKRTAEYVLFDMDGGYFNLPQLFHWTYSHMLGLMLDSEKIYTIATSQSTLSFCFLDIPCKDECRHPWLDAILAKYGKHMTWDMKAGCMGKREHGYPSHQETIWTSEPLSGTTGCDPHTVLLSRYTSWNRWVSTREKSCAGWTVAYRPSDARNPEISAPSEETQHPHGCCHKFSQEKFWNEDRSSSRPVWVFRWENCLWRRHTV